MGQGLSAAITLAEQLATFPQQCLRADRASAIKGCLAPHDSLAQALSQEYKAGLEVVEEAIMGAHQFSKGKGRHGEF